MVVVIVLLIGSGAVWWYTHRDPFLATADGSAVDGYLRAELKDRRYEIVRWWPAIESRAAADDWVARREEYLATVEQRLAANREKLARLSPGQNAGRSSDPANSENVARGLVERDERHAAVIKEAIDRVKERGVFRMMRVQYRVRDAKGVLIPKDQIFGIGNHGAYLEDDQHTRVIVSPEFVD
jgi:hypothetical protein